MLTRLCTFMVGLILGPVAMASPDLAEVWGTKAGELHSSTLVMLETEKSGRAVPPSDAYIIRIERFSYTATHLGLWNEESLHHAAFACLFRDIAQQSERHLETLETSSVPAAREAALTRLITLFDTAQALSSATVYAARRPRTADAEIVPPESCLVTTHLTNRLIDE